MLATIWGMSSGGWPLELFRFNTLFFLFCGYMSTKLPSRHRYSIFGLGSSDFGSMFNAAAKLLDDALLKVWGVLRGGGASQNAENEILSSLMKYYQIIICTVVTKTTFIVMHHLNHNNLQQLATPFIVLLGNHFFTPLPHPPGGRCSSDGNRAWRPAGCRRVGCADYSSMQKISL